MKTISINFIVSQGWEELPDKQLRYVYQFLVDDFATDDKSYQREQSQVRLGMPRAADFAGKKSRPYAFSNGAAPRS